MFDFLLTDEERKVQLEAREFVKSIPRQYILDMDADKIEFPKEFLREAGRRNLLGVRNPAEAGGRGMSWVASQAVLEEIGVLGYIFACTFGVGADLVCDAICKHGNQEQIEKYVKPLLKGEIFAAECLTEPRGGSDFFGATTTAADKGDHYVVNGEKRFIVGGSGADYLFVYARTDLDPKANPHKAISAFIVDTDQAGVKIEHLYGLMGCRGGGTARLVFKDAVVPKENLVGELNGAYDIFNTMMIPERLGTACMTIGSARAAVEIATKYSMKRHQFGYPISKFQGVNFKIADAVRLLDASRAMCYTTCTAIDSGKVDLNEIRRMISQTKKFTTESCQEAAKMSMQVMGGIGYTDVYPIERIVRDLGLASIWTGTSEVMNMIAASEWYKKFGKKASASRAPEDITRDSEADSINAFTEGEKIYTP